jgi:sulfur transfer complex TusBCD TusB component (DsrH family)
MTTSLLATELGELLLTEDGLEIALEDPDLLKHLLAAENGDLLLTEDGYYIEIEFSPSGKPVLFIVNMGRMMGR